MSPSLFNTMEKKSLGGGGAGAGGPVSPGRSGHGSLPKAMSLGAGLASALKQADQKQNGGAAAPAAIADAPVCSSLHQAAMGSSHAPIAMLPSMPAPRSLSRQASLQAPAAAASLSPSHSGALPSIRSLSKLDSLHKQPPSPNASATTVLPQPADGARPSTAYSSCSSSSSIFSHHD
jgi:hypothetical protein